MVYGTRATMRLDVQNMLLPTSAGSGPGPGPSRAGFASSARLFGAFGQTAGNAFAIATRRAPPPGAPVHLIRAHYDALAAGREPPGSLAHARRIAESPGPYADPAEAEQEA